jgi:hypothetical protein
MTDPHVPLPPPTDPTPTPRRWDWRPKLRWFAAEFVVVVTGILVAFAINAWWANVQERAEEREALYALRTEFEAARETITAYRSYQERILTSVGAISDSLHQALASGARQTTVADTALALARVPPTTSVQFGSLESLVASGRLGIIQDRELRSALGGWGVELAELSEDEEMTRAHVFGDLDRALRREVDTYDLWPIADELFGGPESGLALGAPVTLPADTDLAGAFHLRYSLLAHAVDEFPPLVEAVDDILRRIDASLPADPAP